MRTASTFAAPSITADPEDGLQPASQWPPDACASGGFLFAPAPLEPLPMQPNTPPARLSTVARLLAALLALAALGSLGAQMTVRGGGALEAAGAMLRYFTIWANLAAGILFTLAAITGRTGQRTGTALATALAIVAAVYWGLLSGQHHPTGVARITNQFHHTIVPLGAIGWWLAYTKPAERALTLVPAIMAPPVAYGIFAVVLGEATGFYAYFFLDLPRQGVAGFAIAVVVLAMVFALVGLGLNALRSAIARRRASPRPARQPHSPG